MIKLLMLASLLLVVSCSSPIAPTPAQSAPAVVVAPVPVVPTFAVLGDSLSLGSYFTTIEQTIGGTWISTGVGSTTLLRDWQPDGAAYQKMLIKIGDAPVQTFLIHLTANDIAILRPSEQQIYDGFVTLITALHQLRPGSTVLIAEPGDVWTYGDRRVETAAARRAVTRLLQLDGVRSGPQLDDLTTDDGVHFTSSRNSEIIATRWIACLQGIK